MDDFFNKIPEFVNHVSPAVKHAMGLIDRETFERAMEREKINTRIATNINQQVNQQNPTRLDTGPTVDFSNPESIARLEGTNTTPFSNPYYNNLSNPNISQQNNSPYGLNRPYNQIVNSPNIIVNRQYNVGWWDNPNNLKFLELSEDEIKQGKGIKVRVQRGKQDVLNVQGGPPVKKKDSKPTIKVRVARQWVITNSRGEKEVTTEEEYDKYMELENEIQDMITPRVRSITGEPENKPCTTNEKYIRRVYDIARKIEVYDTARAMCLIGYLTDGVTLQQFDRYLRATEDKLDYFQRQEKLHPERNYRVPYRYRRTPKPSVDLNGKIYYKIDDTDNYQIRSKFTLVDGKEIDFYEYDRLREPNDDEWAAFYMRAEYERDSEIVMFATKDIVDYEDREKKIRLYDPQNETEVRLHFLAIQQKAEDDKYSVFRAAYRSVPTEEFNRWYYGGEKPRELTEDEQRKNRNAEWLQNARERHRDLLGTFVPLDLEAIRRWRCQQVRQAWHEFDRGTMDNVKTLKDFFDNLGYLNVRLCEENIERQRAEELSPALTCKNGVFEATLQADCPYKDYTDEQLEEKRKEMGSMGWLIHRTWDEVRATDGYKKRHEAFMNYCAKKPDHIPLKPIYK